jgi:hypothetical protein
MTVRVVDSNFLHPPSNTTLRFLNNSCAEFLAKNLDTFEESPGECKNHTFCTYAEAFGHYFYRPLDSNISYLLSSVTKRQVLFELSQRQKHFPSALEKESRLFTIER